MGGLACGKAVTIAKCHPDTAKTLLAYSAASSLVGVALGVGMAAYRKAPLHIYGFSTGANFALCSFTFFGEGAVSVQIRRGDYYPLIAGVRHVIVETVPWTSESEGDMAGEVDMPHPLASWKREYLGSILSGGVTGSLASILSRTSPK